MITTIELKVSQEVAAAKIEADEYVPAAGSIVHINKFIANGAYTPNAVIRLVWDYEGSEEVIWTIKGESLMPFEHKITDGDGIKRLALVVDNSHTGALYLSGYVQLAVVT